VHFLSVVCQGMTLRPAFPRSGPETTVTGTAALGLRDFQCFHEFSIIRMRHKKRVSTVTQHHSLTRSCKQGIRQGVGRDVRQGVSKV